MNKFRMYLLPAVIISVLALSLGISAQTQQTQQSAPPPQPKYFANPESLITELYRSVTVPPGGPLPDWSKIESMFIGDAVIVMRVSRDSMGILSVDDFVSDFENFFDNSTAQSAGFTERIVKMKPMVFGDIAHILVLYEASITGAKRPPTVGIDSWHLLKKEGRWWITSAVNDITTKERPVPKELSN